MGSRRHRILLGLTVLAMLVTSMAALGSAMAAEGSRSCFPSPAGKTGWWPGDGNTDDVVGGRHAVLHGDAAFGMGLVDQAFALDGDGDFVSVPHDTALNLGTGDFTIDLWVYFNDTQGEQVLIEKWIQGFTRPSVGWTLTKLEDNVIRLAMASGDGDELDIDSDPLTIETETWIHFAATRRRGMVTIYMDGTPIASGEAAVNIDSTSSLKFGHRGNPTDTPGSEDERQFYLSGQLDEVEVFVGRALPRGLINAIQIAAAAGQCKP